MQHAADEKICICGTAEYEKGWQRCYHGAQRYRNGAVGGEKGYSYENIGRGGHQAVVSYDAYAVFSNDSYYNTGDTEYEYLGLSRAICFDKKKIRRKQMDDLRMFWEEEEGMGTVEMVLLIAALVAVAIAFKTGLLKFIEKAMEKVFNKAENGI